MYWKRSSLFAIVTFIAAAAAISSAQSHQDTSRPARAGRVTGKVITPNSVPRPWELSDDERIARRLAFANPVTGGRARTTQAPNGYGESIEGRDHPELFFSYELFDGLLAGVNANATRRAAARRTLDPKIRANGYDVNTFWATVERISDRYVQMREEHRRQNKSSTILKMPDGTPILVPVNREVCGARYDALQQARHAFGEETFDRFLYESVAPEVAHSEGGSSPGRSEQLRFMARGCR